MGFWTDWAAYLFYYDYGISNRGMNIMANVFILTVNDTNSRQRFCATVEQGYELEQILPHIKEESQRHKLQQFYTDTTCYLWGEAEKSGGTRSEWEKMSDGDLVLGYHENAIIAVSQVLYKRDDPELADHIWGKHNGNSLRLIFFMTRPHLCNVTIVPRMLNYLDQSYDGFTHLGPDKIENILAHYISLDDFARLLFGKDFPTSLRHSE